jgi:hypothetical protein
MAFVSTIKDMAANKVAIKRDTEIFERQARICKAFAHPGRLQILDRSGARVNEEFPSCKKR